MTTSEKLMADCDRLIKQATEVKAFIAQHAAGFDNFGNGSSFGNALQSAFYLHDPAEDSRPFCKAVGGTWKKDRGNDGGRIDYRGKLENGVDVHIFDAEKANPLEELFL